MHGCFYRLFGTPWTLALQAPRSVGFSRKEYWNWSEVKSLSRVRLCDPTDCSLPGSLVHGIFQARVLEWVVIAFSDRRGCHAKLFQSCPTLCDPIDSSRPGSPVPGILQARTLEWVAISFSNAWKWKVKAKSLSHVRPSADPHGLQPSRLRRPWDFPGKSIGVGCHRLLRPTCIIVVLFSL